MSKLDAFLHPVEVEQTKEVVVSKRFLDEKGKPAPFVIRTITEEENRAIRKACTRKSRDRNGAMVSDFDSEAYSAKIVLAGTVEPDFSKQEMCSAYGTLDPMEVPIKMLLAGEYRLLSDAIAEFSGFAEDVDEEAKNS